MLHHARGLPATADRPQARAPSGLSLVELVIVLALLPMVLGMGFLALRSAGVLGASVVESTTSLDKLRYCLRRIGDELMGSSLIGEDQNGNKKLDAGEDTNGNGRLDSDWAVGEGTITFNRALPSGTWSLPISYEVRDGRLVRSQLRPNGSPVVAEIASDVQGFSVLAADKQITVSLSVGSRGASPHSSAITVTQRN